MIFDPEELVPSVVKVTPRICHGGELLAMLIGAYGKTAATHLWDIGVARSFSNTEEIEKEIASEVERKGCSRIQAQRNLILRSGLYKLKETPLEGEVHVPLPKDLAEQIKAAADAQGISVEEYLRRTVS